MNYYEELGIKPNADAEEIRRAHRRLVKLMHPDHQRDQNLKMLAETQMRRLNSIVAVLLNPEERQEYDQELYDRDNVKPPTQTVWRSVPLWLASVMCAVILAAGGVWFYADHVGNGLGGNRNPVYIPPQETSSRPDAPAKSAPAAEDPVSSLGPTALPGPTVDGDIRNTAPKVSAASIPASSKPATSAFDNRQMLSERARAVEAARAAELKTAHENKLRDDAEKAKAAELIKARQLTPSKSMQVAQTRQDGVPGPREAQKTAPAKKVFNLPSNVQMASARRPPAQTQTPFAPPPGLYPALTPREDSLTGVSPLPVAKAPKPEPGGSPDIPAVPSVHRDPLEGDWVYAPKEPEKRRAGFYPPQFISLKLSKQADGFHGQYSARYDVADNRPISPDVNFQLKSVDTTARRFIWQSADGSRGTLAIHPLDATTIRLEWRTTVFSGGPALSSGIATLVRRGD